MLNRSLLRRFSSAPAGASDVHGRSVCMFVYNTCTTDPRVVKEARSLSAAGYRVKVIAVLVKGLPVRESHDGFEIVRIERRPLHYRAIEGLRRLAKRPADVSSSVPTLSRPMPTEAPPAPATTARGPARMAVYGLLRRLIGTVHRPLMMFDYYVRSFRLVRAEPASLLHAHDLLTLPVGVALKLATRASLIYDAHELYPEVSTLSPRERRTWGWVESRLIGKADAVITVCESIADELAARYRVGRPAVVLNCPPTAPRAEAVGPDALGAAGRTGPIVLYTGGLAPHRGLETLIRSARGLESGLIVLMGSGRLRASLERLIEHEQVGDRVVIRDPVPPEAVASHTAAADIGVIPYEPVGLNNRFTTPNKLFDYMAAGLPIVASRLPELERFVMEPLRGLLFEPGDAAALAAAVNRISGDASLRRQMSEGSREGGERFTWEAQATGLLDLYRIVGADAPLASTA